MNQRSKKKKKRGSAALFTSPLFSIASCDPLNELVSRVQFFTTEVACPGRRRGRGKEFAGGQIALSRKTTSVSAFSPAKQSYVAFSKNGDDRSPTRRWFASNSTAGGVLGMESSHDVADLGDTVSLTGLQVSLCMVYCCAISAIVTTRPWGWWCFVVDRAKTIV